MKKTFIFTVTVQSEGKDVINAWENAELGDTRYDDFQQICSICGENINECTCLPDSGDALSESWLNKADDKTERENK
jgi:hypothetical protein